MEADIYAGKILDAYVALFSRNIEGLRISKENPHLKEMLGDGREEAARERRNKWLYGLMLVAKFLLITVFRVDSGTVSFDTYQYEKERWGLSERAKFGRELAQQVLETLQEREEREVEMKAFVLRLKQEVQAERAEEFMGAFVAHKTDFMVGSLCETVRAMGIALPQGAAIYRPSEKPPEEMKQIEALLRAYEQERRNRDDEACCISD